ncbi:hypothetical protein VTN00DRAFT_9433 [Thermoascus crustaceus]|uniref:uncharacterized protein n=1 Tax=Thermoascus crustaceus TaxID=5088 RepID=UPI003743F7A1
MELCDNARQLYTMSALWYDSIIGNFWLKESRSSTAENDLSEPERTGILTRSIDLATESLYIIGGGIIPTPTIPGLMPPSRQRVLADPPNIQRSLADRAFAPLRPQARHKQEDGLGA